MLLVKNVQNSKNKRVNEKVNIIGIDNLNSYYDVNLKLARIGELKKYNKNFIFYKIDIEDTKNVDKIFNSHGH